MNRNFLTSSVLLLRHLFNQVSYASLNIFIAPDVAINSELFSSMIVQFWVIDMLVSFLSIPLKGGSDVYACLVGDA